MIVCKHCGAELEESLEYCPNCGQKNTQKESSSKGDFFDSDSELESNYSIFDDFDDFDTLLSQEFSKNEVGAKQKESSLEEISDTPITSISDILEEDQIKESEATIEELDSNGLEELQSLEEMDFVLPDGTSASGMGFALDDLSTQDTLEETTFTKDTESSINNLNALDSDLVKELNFVELDNLFQDLEKEENKEKEKSDQDLSAMLAGSLEEEAGKEKKKKEKKNKKEKKPFFQSVFGNVPIDPSKIKPEPTEEELAEAKAKKAEEKKQAKEAKKVAKQQKQEADKLEKERKIQEKALAKEAKKAKKLEAAKQILEEVQETRINRVGATVVFVLFAVCAVGIVFGSDLFSYSVSVDSAEKSFNLALNNDVAYYNDAYEQIYGLDIKPEDQVLNDKIMTVMFVNKELNSYNSYMIMEDYESALHSLLKGIYRYGKYYESAIPLGIDRDLDFVRTQILKELEKTFHISEDEVEVLRSQLEQAMTNEEASKEYSLTIYEIIKECKLAKE